MRVNDREMRRYYREIRSWLPCSHKQKKQIIGQIHGRVQDYLVQNPDADIQALRAEFGAPQTIAAAYVDNSSTEEILRGLRARRRIATIVVATVIAILITWAAAVTYATIEVHNSANGTVIATTNNDEQYTDGRHEK